MTGEVQLNMREELMALEKVMLSMPQAHIPVTHTFCDGMYARAAFIEAGTRMTGFIHMQPNLQIMVSGDVTVITEDGEERLKGFNIMSGRAGIKRAGKAHEDTIWVTILRTELTDVTEIERTLVTNDYSRLLELKGI